MRIGQRLPAAGAALLVTIGLVLATAAPVSAQDYQPVQIVHTERVRAGHYGMTVGFSTWPLRARRSLDFTFMPDGGITGKSGTIQPIGPLKVKTEPLVRHPRKRDVWGWDIRALGAEGTWTFRFTIDGPAGTGVGELDNLTVLEQPGPPMALSWSIGTLPLLGLVAFIAIAWRRNRPGAIGSDGGSEIK